MSIYSKVAGCQSSRSKIIRMAWLLSSKIAMLKWGPGSILGLGELWRLVTLQSFNLQGSIVPHLKDLIHICLEPEAHDCGMTFYMCYVGSKYPYLIPHRGKWVYLSYHRCITKTQQKLFMRLEWWFLNGAKFSFSNTISIINTFRGWRVKSSINGYKGFLILRCLIWVHQI